MAQFALFQYAPKPADIMASPQDELEAHDAYGQKYGDRMVSAFAFQPSTTAKAVRGDGVSDGPFVDSDLVIGGFCVIEAADLDEATKIAQESPATRRGGVEVRPVFAPPEE